MAEAVKLVLGFLYFCICILILCFNFVLWVNMGVTQVVYCTRTVDTLDVSSFVID